MVLAQRVGTPRSFGLGLLFTIVTFGVYAVYWNYKVHNEVYRQFELARENRDEGMIWYVLGLVVPPFLLGYFWVMADNVTYLRDRIGLPRGQTPGRFVGLIASAAAALGVSIFLLVFAPVAPDGGELSAADESAFAAMGGIAFVLAITALVLLLVAFHGMQRDLNELWAAYDARMAYLRAHPLPPGPLAGPVGGTLFERVAPVAPMPPNAPGGYSYYADLAPPPTYSPVPPPAHGPAPPPYAPGAAYAPAPPAPQHPLQREWRLLQEQNPGVVSQDMEELLAAAARGDEFAHQRAAALLRERRALAQERGDLLRRRDALVEALRALEERLASAEIGAAAHEVERTMVERDLASLVERLGVIEARLFQDR